MPFRGLINIPDSQMTRGNFSKEVGSMVLWWVFQSPLQDTFCPFETCCFFNTEIKLDTHHVQVAMFRCFSCKDPSFPVILGNPLPFWAAPCPKDFASGVKRCLRSWARPRNWHRALRIFEAQFVFYPTQPTNPSQKKTAQTREPATFSVFSPSELFWDEFESGVLCPFEFRHAGSPIASG